MGRLSVSAVATLVALGALACGAHAQGDQQKQQWCAYFTGGPTNCEFATFDDCLQAIKGKTALCVQNAQYVTPVDQSGSSGKGRRHRAAQR